MQESREYHSYREDEVNIRKLLHIIFTKRWILYSIIAVIMVIDIIYTFKQKPVYRASSMILIEKPYSSSLTASQSKELITADIGPSDYYNTQYEILKSRMLMKRVAKSLDLGLTNDFKGEAPESRLQKAVGIYPVRNSRLVKINVDSRDPLLATKIANTIASVYIEQNIENILFMSKEILRTFPNDAAEIEKNTIYGQLKDMNKKEMVDSLPSVMNNQVLQKLKSEKITLDTELANLSQRYKEKHPKIVALKTKLKFINSTIEEETNRVMGSLRADLAGTLQANNIRVIDYAEVPKHPIKPKKMVNMVLGFLFSTFLGITVIFFSEYLDNSVKTQEDVEKTLVLPFLGDFPPLGIDFPSKIRNGSLSEIDKDMKAAEAMGNIRTNVIFSMPKDFLKTILITSALPKEGKTLLSCYLAFSLAKNGFKTLVLDADIRRPRIHKIFDIPQTPGLVNILVEGLEVEKVIRKTSCENLYVLPSGANTPNPLELLSSGKMDGMMKQLSGNFEKIVIDTPPSLNISDALILSKLCSSVIFVTKNGMADKDVLSELKNKFTMIGSKIIGVILNFSNAEKSSYYKSKYYNKYYKDYYLPAEDKLASIQK